MTRMLVPPLADSVQLSDEVHVWRASLDVPAWRVQSLRRTLAADELSKAARFGFRKNREHFIVARGLLRTIPPWPLLG